MKIKTTTLFLLSILFGGCTNHPPKYTLLISDLVFPEFDKNALYSNKIRKSIIYYQDSFKNKKQVGYELFDSLGNLSFSEAKYQRTYLKYDSLGLLTKKEFITDFNAPFSIKYDFFPKEKKLHQIWFYTLLSLEEIDTNKIPPSDTTILKFSKKNLLQFENGYLHEDKGIKSIAYEKKYQYDSLNRVTKITSLYLNLDKDFRYTSVTHNYWESMTLSPKPKIEEFFKYKGKGRQLIQKESIYSDLSMQTDTFIRKTIYTPYGLKEEIINPIYQSGLKIFYSTSDTIKLKNIK